VADSIDVSEVTALAADLGKAGQRMARVALPAMHRAGIAIRDGMRADASGISHAPHFPRSISYDLTEAYGWTTAGYEVEVGPDKTKTQGALGNILAFGTARQGPTFSLDASLNREVPKIAQALGLAAAEAVLS
jgi:hypothetical protein